MIITVTVQVPMKAGDTYQTPFYVATVTETQAASGFYNKTVSASRTVESAANPQAVANMVDTIVATLTQ